jgi:cation diffusion facilitator family transporter
MTDSGSRHGAHSHSFGQQEIRAGEKRTLIVVILTAVMMVAEIVFGILFGSMALLADGMHMASHAVALGISFAAYVLARRHSTDSRYSFGSGKLNPLAAYTSAILLGLFTLVMAYESVRRMLNPVEIEFNQAIFVAVIGLIVNGVSVWILQGGHESNHHHHSHSHSHEHDHGHSHSHEQDHNLKAAYLHVLADALTSVLAIAALLGGKYLAWNWLDPLMGILGAILVGRWAISLAFLSSRVLLDHQAADHVLGDIRAALESDGDTRVTDLHIWSIGPAIYAAAIALATSSHKSADEYRRLLHGKHGVAHLTIEIHDRSPGDVG